MKAIAWIAIVIGGIIIGNALLAWTRNVGALQSSANALNHTPCLREDAACGLAPNADPIAREGVQSLVGLVFLLPGAALLLRRGPA